MRSRAILALVLGFGVAFLSACAVPDGQSTYDPLEPVNRSIHGVNKALDTVALKPASQAYGAVLPQEIRTGINNFGENLSTPTTIVNDILQFRLEDVLHNTTRFVLNTTIGLGGLLDPASKLGLEPRPSDFGETLHVWGFGEGPYVELPVLGPSNTRDAIGQLVDAAINPMANILPAEQAWLIPTTQVTGILDSRYTFGTTVDSVLYESEDSYAQSQLFYLENRRFELGGGSAGADEDLFDIYEEAFE